MTWLAWATGERDRILDAGQWRQIRDFDAVGMGGAKFDSIEFRFFTVFDDGRDVPVFGEIVSDGSEPNL